MASIFGAVLLTIASAADDPKGGAERELFDLENQIAAAVVRGDLAFIDRVWADDFFYTGVRGEVKTKAEVLSDFKSGDMKFELLKFDDIKVRVFGDTGVVTGRATTKGKGKSGEITGEFRYTRVYVKRDGRWRLIAFQGTPIVK